MSHPSKRKGTAYERELVDQAKARGLEAKRAWGSNGASLGLLPEVDLVVAGQPIQAKRRARFPKWFKVVLDNAPVRTADIPTYLKIPAGCNAVVCREDGGKSYAITAQVYTGEFYVESYPDFLTRMVALYGNS